MQLVPELWIVEDLPHCIKLHCDLVILNEVFGDGSAWILDLLVAIGEGEQSHRAVRIELVLAMRPADDTGDTRWLRTCIPRICMSENESN